MKYGTEYVVMTTKHAAPTADEIIGIPQDLMERYGIHPDDLILVDEQRDRIVLRKVTDPIGHLFEVLKDTGTSLEDWEEIHKGRQDDPNRV